MENTKKRQIVEQFKVENDFEDILFFCKNHGIKVPIMPLKEIPLFLEQNLSLSQLELLYTVILERRALLKPKTDTNRIVERGDKPKGHGSNLSTGYYSFLSIYFGILFINICFHLKANIHFPSIFFTICSTFVALSVLFILPLLPYKNRGHSILLKALNRKKILFFIYLSIPTGLFLIFFIPMGFNNPFLEFLWAFSLFWTAFSFIYEGTYIWKFVLTGLISVKYVSKLHLVYFLISFLPFAFGYLFLWYNPLSYATPNQIVAFYAFFPTEGIVLVNLFTGLEGIQKLKGNFPDHQLSVSLRKSIFLSSNFHIKVVIPVLIVTTILILPFVYYTLPIIGLKIIIIIGLFHYTNKVRNF
ncbi:MAG: hypothetical protein ACTSQI_17740 [Candidatus Helarchaeota archaeon]